MDIYIGSDHAGFSAKQELIAVLQADGVEIHDMGTHSEESCDYPDIAIAVSEALVNAQEQGVNARGVLLCGSGIGMSIAANKVRGVRAALATNEYMAAQGVEHDGANVLVLAARVNNLEEMKVMTRAFVQAEMSTEEKYRRRMNTVIAYEDANMKKPN